MSIFSKKPLRNADEDYFDDRYYDDGPEADVEPEGAGAQSNLGFGGVSLGGSSIELKVVRPERFEDVSSIADHLLSGRTVVLNMEAAGKELSRRLIDFLSGVAYSIEGQLKRVANTTYIITPNNVDVSDSSLRGERGAGPMDLDDAE